MTTLITPEIAASFGALDDAAFADGSPFSAHVIRELSRNANLHRSRGGLLYRWVNLVENSQGETFLPTRVVAPPLWSSMLPEGVIRIQKKAGLNRARVKIRYSLQSGKTVYLFVGSNGQHDPTLYGSSAERFIKCSGTGAEDTVTVANIDMGDAPHGYISFGICAAIDPDVDTAYAYYPSGTGAVSPTTWDYTADSAAWLNGAVAYAGVYCVLTANNGGNNSLHQVVNNTGLKVLHLWPEIGTMITTNYDYALYYLPVFSLYSIAVYAQGTTP